MPKKKYYYRKGKGGKKIRCKMPRGKSTRGKRRSETVAGQRKYHRGGQVKGYTMGEAMHSENWP